MDGALSCREMSGTAATRQFVAVYFIHRRPPYNAAAASAECPLTLAKVMYTTLCEPACTQSPKKAAT